MSDNLNALYEKLLEAQENGEVITMVYSGGSMAGQPRDVAPIKVGPDKMRARCYVSDAVKTFKLDKIAVPAWELSAEIQPEPPFVVDDDLFQSFAKRIEQKGYHASFDQGLTVHKLYKNGKAQKKVIAGVQITKGADRPYYVSGPSLWDGRYFSYEDKAYKLFAEVIDHLDDLNADDSVASEKSVDSVKGAASDNLEPLQRMFFHYFNVLIPVCCTKSSLAEEIDRLLCKWRDKDDPRYEQWDDFENAFTDLQDRLTLELAHLKVPDPELLYLTMRRLIAEGVEPSNSDFVFSVERRLWETRPELRIE